MWGSDFNVVLTVDVQLDLNWSTAFRNPHHLLTFAYDFANMSDDPTE
jgi:hypothetical protein